MIKNKFYQTEIKGLKKESVKMTSSTSMGMYNVVVEEEPENKNMMDNKGYYNVIIEETDQEKQKVFIDPSFIFLIQDKIKHIENIIVSIKKQIASLMIS